MRLRLDGADLSAPDMDGGAQRVDGDVLELRDPQALQAERADPDAAHYLAPEPFIESDAPEIVAEAEAAVRGVTGTRERAERLTRYVNALLEKKPTISLPSAREVLRTKVGDCNEHTALYVAMARALGLPARIAVGMVYIHGAFYYHAWPEVYIDDRRRPRPLAARRSDVESVSRRRDAPPSRPRRPRQAGRDSSLDRAAEDDGARSRGRPRLDADPGRPAACGSRRAGDPDSAARAPLLRVPAMIAIHDLVKHYGPFTAVDGVSLDVTPGEIHGFLGPNGAGKTTTLRMIAGLLKPSAGRILVNGHEAPGSWSRR